MNDNQLSRYSRQILLPEIDIDGQQKLVDASVAIVGLGGLGSPTALYLAAAGIGSLTLCDPDRVDLSNLQRQILHNTGDIGSAKTDSAARTLRRLNPETRLTLVEQRLDEPGLTALAAKVDIVIDASDNFETRFAVNRACVETATPLVSGAAIRWDGQISVFTNRDDSACYQCLYPVAGSEEERCVETGVVAPLVGVIGSMQALEAIKLITNTGTSLSHRLLTLDSQQMVWREFRFSKDPGCPVCANKTRKTPSSR